MAATFSKAELSARLRFRDRMRSTRWKYRELDGARKSLPPSLYADSYAWTRSQSAMAKNLPFPGFPADMSAVGRYAPMAEVGTNRELKWAVAALSYDSVQLNRFIVARREFWNSLLIDSPNKAEEHLRSIQSDFGHSLWLAKTRIAVEHYRHLAEPQKGMEAQKRIAAELKAALPPTSIPAYIVHQVSVRNEPSVTPSRFVAQLRRTIDDFAIGPDWKHVIRFHVFGGWPTTWLEATAVLRHSYAHSVVDYYDAFLHVAATALALGDDSAIGQVGSSAVQLADSVTDSRLANLIANLTDKPVTVGNDASAVYLAFAKGDHGHSQSLAAQEFDRNPSDATSYLLSDLVNSPDTNDDRLAKHLLANVRHVTSLDDAAAAAASELDRAALNLPSLPVVGALNALCVRRVTPVPVFGSQATFPATNDALEASHRQLRYTLADSLVADPLLIRGLDEGWLGRIAKQTVDNDEASECIRAYVTGSDCDPSIVGVERAVFALRSALRAGNYVDAAKAAGEVQASTVASYQVQGTIALVHSLLALKQYPECSAAMATAIVERPSIRSALPLRDFLDSLSRIDRTSLGTSVDFAIVLDAYSTSGDDSYDSHRRWAVRDALWALGIKRPSQLREKVAELDHKKLVYFLHRLCVPGIIYVTAQHKGSIELNEERIAVLELLRDIDPDNRMVYETEKVEVTRTIVLQTRRVEVEQSKIQVSYADFFRAADQSLREIYNRYLAYVISGIPAVKSDAQPVPSAQDGAPQLAVAVPTNEAADLFAGLVRDMHELFVGKSYHGLDWFLGTRIRHGIIEGELRHPLTAQRLLGVKDQITGKYTNAESWISALPPAESDVAELVDRSLQQFGEQFDSLVREIKLEWIRVRRSPDDRGMIAVAVPEQQYEAWVGVVARLQPSFDEFAAAAFTVFVQLLEPELLQIRNRILDEASNRATEMLLNLERSLLSDQRLPALLPQLPDAVREVGPQLRLAFERVAEWFKLGFQVSAEPFPFEDVIRIAFEMYRRFDPNFILETALGDTKNEMIPGALVAAYTHLFLMLFSNVSDHARLGGTPKIIMRAERKASAIQLVLENELGADFDIKNCEQRIHVIQEAIANGTYREDFDQERGTGLVRAYDIVRNGLLIDPEMRMSVTPERKFRLEMRLPAAGG